MSIEKFEKAVLQDIDNEIKKISLEKNNLSDFSLIEFENKQKEKLENIIFFQNNKAEDDYNKKISIIKKDFNCKLIIKRNQIKKLLREKIINKIKNLIESPDYINFTKDSIKYNLFKYNIKNFNIFIKKDQVNIFKDQILKNIEYFKIIPSQQIKLGGYLIEDNDSNIVINKSFEDYFDIIDNKINQIENLKIR